jgi:hypothetical protein
VQRAGPTASMIQNDHGAMGPVKVALLSPSAQEEMPAIAFNPADFYEPGPGLKKGIRMCQGGRAVQMSVIDAYVGGGGMKVSDAGCMARESSEQQPVVDDTSHGMS